MKTILRYLGIDTLLRTGSIDSELNRTNIVTALRAIVSPSSTPTPSTGDHVLIENSDFRLLESGDKLLLG